MSLLTILVSALVGGADEWLLRIFAHALDEADRRGCGEPPTPGTGTLPENREVP
jgi:hypothetical protein